MTAAAPNDASDPRSDEDKLQEQTTTADRTITTAMGEMDVGDAKRLISQGIRLNRRSTKKSSGSFRPKDDDSSALSFSQRDSISSTRSRRMSRSASSRSSMLVDAKHNIHNMRSSQLTSASDNEDNEQLDGGESINQQQRQPGGRALGGGAPTPVVVDRVASAAENATPELVAEIVKDPVMADVVDTKADETKGKGRKIIAIAVVVCVAIIAVVGGVCGSGGCRRPVEAFDEIQECNLYVSPIASIITDTYTVRNALAKSDPLNCEFNSEVDPDEVCPKPLENDCFEPPYLIEMLYNGGSCAENYYEGIPDNVSCQDGEAGSPPHWFNSNETIYVYIRVTDLQLEGLVYFDDYVQGLDTISIYNKGSPIGTDLLIQIFESGEPDANILQIVYYYSVCSNKSEYLAMMGALQVVHFSFGSQRIEIRNNTESLKVAVNAKGPLKLLLGAGPDASPQITVDKVALFPNYAAPTEITGVMFNPIDETAALDGVLLTAQEIPVTWTANTTDRITLRAEVHGAGPNGEACTGTGILNFLMQHV